MNGSAVGFRIGLGVIIVGAVFLAWSMWHSAASGTSKSGGDLVGGPHPPATHIVPLTAWGRDGSRIPNVQFRTVRVGTSCFVETVSGDNGLNVSLAPMGCPQ